MDDKEKNQALIEFGSNLRSIRHKRELSQEQLADLAGIDRSYLGAVERGEHNLALLNIIRVANALGVSPAALFDCFAKPKKGGK